MCAWAHVWVSVSECLCVHMRVVHKAAVIIYSCRTTTDATTTAWVSLPHNWPTRAHYMTKSSDKNLTKCQKATYMSRVLSAWAVRVAYKLQYNTWRDLGRDRVQGCVHMNVYMDIQNMGMHEKNKQAAVGVYMYVLMCVILCAYVCLYGCVCAYAFVWSCVCMRLCMVICMCVCVYVCVCFVLAKKSVTISMDPSSNFESLNMGMELHSHHHHTLVHVLKDLLLRIYLQWQRLVANLLNLSPIASPYSLTYIHHAHTNIHTCTHKQTYIHAHTNIRTYVHTQTYIHAHMCTCACAHTHTHTHTRTHASMNILYTHILSPLDLWTLGGSSDWHS